MFSSYVRGQTLIVFSVCLSLSIYLCTYTLPISCRKHLQAQILPSFTIYIYNMYCIVYLNSEPYLQNMPSRYTCPVDAHAQWMHMTSGCTCPVDAHTQWMHMPSGCTCPVDAHAQ